jgi:DNA-binding response OmpR family regulator
MSDGIAWQTMIEAFSSHGSVLATGPARILLAEDDAEFRALLALVLAGDGYAVDQVPDGTAFLQRVGEQGDCDLIITDVHMPGPSGLDVVTRLRRRGSRTPVIVLTAMRDESTRCRALLLGAKLFHKPFDLDDLRTAVLNTLAHGPTASGEPQGGQLAAG